MTSASGGAPSSMIVPLTVPAVASSIAAAAGSAAAGASVDSPPPPQAAARTISKIETNAHDFRAFIEILLIRKVGKKGYRSVLVLLADALPTVINITGRRAP